VAEDQPPYILLVDDDESGRRLLEIILQREGYRVEQAESGEEALQMIAETLPDLIILDDVLPGIWGDEVREKLKHNPATSSVRIIMYTGRHDKLEGFRQREDVAGVLAKPSHPQEVLATVKACLGG
jgi:DNA-binding response OmpR family regulator